MSSEIAHQHRPTDVAPANGTNLPTVMGTVMAELQAAVTAMKADDISLELTVGQDQNRSHARFCFRAYRRHTEIFSAERESNG
jgi:hypothetical protein